MKLILLLLFLSVKTSTVQAFNVNDIQLNDDACIFCLKKLLKTSKPGSHKYTVVFQRYVNRDLCPSALKTVCTDTFS